MDLNFDLEDRYKAGLRKWDKYGLGVIPAWVAEHDFGSPSAVHERLSDVLSLGAFGYHDEDRKLGESFASWADSRNSWKLNPEQVIPTVTVLQGVAACVEAFSSVGDGVLYNTPS